MILLAATFCLVAVPAAGADDNPLTLQLSWTEQFQFAGYIAAIEKGFYRAEGLDVTLRALEPGRTPIGAVMAGDAHYGVAGSELLLEHLRGAPVVALAPILQHSPFVIMTRSDAAILWPADLIGKRVMLPGGGRGAELAALLQRERVPLDRLTLVPHSRDVADLVEGRVDAMGVYATTQADQVRAGGVSVRLMRPVDYGIDFYGDILFTTRDEVALHPERAAAFRRASLRGWEHALANTDEVIELILARQAAQPPGGGAQPGRAELRSEAELMRPLIVPDVIELGHSNPQRWERIATTYGALGMADASRSSSPDLAGFLYDAGGAARVPPWARWLATAVLVAAGLAGAFAVWTVQLRRAAAARTRELAARNEALEAERRLHEQAVAESRRFARMIEHSPDFVASATPDGRLHYVNPAGRALVGAAADRLESTLPPWALRRFRDEALPAAERDGAWTGDSALLTADGREVPVSQVVIAERGEGTRAGGDAPVTRITIHARDLSGTRLTESQLKESRERLTLLSAIATIANSGAPADAVIGRALREIHARSPALGVACATIGDDGVLRTLGHLGAVPAAAAGADLASAPDLLLALRRLEPVAISDAATDPFTQSPPGPGAVAGAVAALCVPFRHDARQTGVLCFLSPQRHSWGHHEFRTLAEVADYLALVLKELRATEGRRAAQEDLRVSEERFRQIADTVEDVFWIVDLHPRALVYANPAFERVFGLPFDRIRADPGLWGGLVHPDDRTAFKRAFERWAAGEEGAVEYRIRRPDGGDRWIRDRGARITDPAGRVYRVVGLAEDVTHARAIADALRASEERFDLAVRGTSDGLWDWDLRVNAVWYSPRFKALLGVGEADFPPTPDAWRATIAPPALDRVQREILRHFRTREPFDVECPMRTRADGERWFRVRGQAVWDERGRPVRMAGAITDVTEQKRIEVELREGEALFRALADAVPVLIWMSGIDKGCHYFNETWLAFTGRELDQEIGAGWAEGVHPDDLDGRFRAHSEAFDGRRPFSLEYRLRRRDGVYRWVLDQGVPRHDAGGTFVGYIGSCIDITERRDSEAATRASEERYRRIVETAEEGIWVVDREWRTTFVNARMASLLGHEPDEMVGRHMLEFTDEEGRRIAADSIRRGSDDARASYELRYVARDGRVVWGIVSTNSITDDAGNFLGALAMVTDITARREAEATTAQWKARYEAAADASRQALYDWDLATGAVLWGGDTTGVFGREAAAMGDLADRIHPDDRPAFDAEVRRVVEGRLPFTLEYRARRDDGRYVHLADNGRFFGDPARPGARMVGFIADVTERVTAREELARRAQELARSNAELERFAYVASHDLQEPLRMVISFTQLLSKRYQGRLGADADEFIGFAVEGATRMQQLIQDLLAYSRVGNAPRRLGPVPAAAALSRAVANLNAAIRDSGAEVTAGELPVVTADEPQLGLLFQNLVGNAIKFRRGAGPRVRVSAVRRQDDWLFCVHDDGIGIEDRHKERIFTMFQRLHARTDYQGNGIGLAICKRIVEGHGGSIWVESRPGAGSDFYFTLPAAADEPASDAAHPPAPPATPTHAGSAP